LSFFFNVHNNFLEEIAKFRAARRLWGRVMKERFGAKDPRSMMLRTHAQTAGSSLTAQQPDNNVVRTTLQALAAVLGGTQSLHTNSKDEALGLPTEDSVRVALRTQQVIAHESGVSDSIDPLAGSYCIESLTNELERRAEEYIAAIDKLGGAVRAVDLGYQQREIHNAAYRYQQEIERKDRVIVGVNEFTVAEEPKQEILRIDPDLERRQIAKLARVRAERNQSAAARAVLRVENMARGGGNVMPAIVDAVRAYATLGEIADAMRRVFGEYRPATTL
jgi:methylmalonyl-CoA mutase N-terminal domain/subunit